MHARSKPIGIIGLGLIGTSLARRLLAASFEVHGYDIDAARRAHLASHGGHAAATLRDIGQCCDTLLISVQINFPSAAPATPLIYSGKIRALAFTGATRVAAMPDVPTIAEAGLPGFEFDAGWHGWFAPAMTPPAILDRIHAEIVRALQAPQVRDFYSKNGYEPVAQKPAEFRRVFLDDIARYAQIVRAAKIEKQ